MDELLIGQLVRANLPQMFEHCATVDPEELTKLADRDYCKDVFNLNWAFWATPAEAELIKQRDPNRKDRYWTPVHEVLGHHARITNDWFEKRHRDLFLLYLVDKGLTPVDVAPENVTDAIDQVTAPTAAEKKQPGGARFKKTAIGVAQNAAVRNVLGSLGIEAFTAKDWMNVKQSFGHRCAYCSSGRQIVMDHAVPISRDILGEHRLGNLVPACHDCNSAKGQKRYDEYLRTTRDLPDPVGRIATIEAHMRNHNYAPIIDTLSPETTEQVQRALQDLRQQVGAAAVTAIAAINDSLQEGRRR